MKGRIDQRRQRRKNAIKNVIAILIILTGVGYVAYKGHTGKKAVNKLCAQVEIGKPVDIYKRKATELGLNTRLIERSKNPEEPNLFMAWAGFSFSRYFCNIEFDDKGIVTARHQTYID
ncbi:MAG: hypothetical protein V3S46_04380 [Nitrospinota bacterium]